MKFDVEKLMRGIRAYIKLRNDEEKQELYTRLEEQSEIIQALRSTVKELSEKIENVESEESTYEIDETVLSGLIDSRIDAKSEALKTTVSIEYDDERTFTVAVDDLVKTFEVPAQIYKGIHEEGGEYSKGDTVTSQGALWHCKQLTDEKPGDSEHWQLAVKSGRK